MKTRAAGDWLTLTAEIYQRDQIETVKVSRPVTTAYLNSRGLNAITLAWPARVPR
jgi:hypothetical protein